MPSRLPVLAFPTLLLALSISAARGDEGLWTFDKFPAEKVRAAYGFAPDAAWLKRVMGGSVLLDSGCSGGLVSAEGLVQTSYHCVQDCIHSLSAPGFDPNLDAMIVRAAAEERTCPGLHADIATLISDVTATVAEAKKGQTYRLVAASGLRKIEDLCIVVARP